MCETVAVWQEKENFDKFLRLFSSPFELSNHNELRGGLSCQVLFVISNGS